MSCTPLKNVVCVQEEAFGSGPAASALASTIPDNVTLDALVRILAERLHAVLLPYHPQVLGRCRVLWTSPESQGQNLAVTVLYVPSSLDSGPITAAQ